MVTEIELQGYLFGWQVEDNARFANYFLSEIERQTAVSVVKMIFENGVDAREALHSVCKRDFLLLSAENGDKIALLCSSLLSGFGPLDPLIGDENIEEIALSGVNEPVRVFIVGKGWVDSGLAFTSRECVYHFLNKLSVETGRRLTLATPILNSFLPNGSRLHAVSDQISSKITFTLRKFRTVPFTLGNLIENKTISKEASYFLTHAVGNGSSLLIAGNTGSGKTTLLNAILSTLPSSERFVMVEDVSEISLPRHKHKVRLLADVNVGISLNQLVYESLRMRPDRLVVSEIRNESEVKAFSNALLSGPGKACFTTFHANSAQEALRRLQLLGFRQVDLDSIGLIAVQKRLGSGENEKRRVTEIASVKNGKAIVLFQYSAVRDWLEQKCKTKEGVLYTGK